MGEYSFARSERLLKPDEFVKVRKSGKRFYTKSFTVFILPNSLGRRRLGLSAGSRVGNAVRRNRIKRLLREFFRLNKGSFPDETDILISVKNAGYVNGLRDVESELIPALEKAARAPWTRETDGTPENNKGA